MKPRCHRLAVALLPLVAVPCPQDSVPPAISEVDAFEHAPGTLPVGRLYRYRKSNIDGSNESRVDLYVASETRIESFKYHEGGSEATLVTADMDWTKFSVRRFETSKHFTGGRVQPVATLEDRDGVLHGDLRGTTFTLRVARYPWHTYDFDLTSLNLGLRYLVDPEGVAPLGMIDVVEGRLKNIGVVDLSYLDDQERHGVECRRYSLDGPGLDDRGGHLWVRKGKDPVIVDYEIDKPDEPGMKSGKMLLLETRQLSREQWLELRSAALRR